MLPINKKNGPCDPISSNCVIWQGPDLPCVDICNGDSISAIIAELCNKLVILQEGNNTGIDLTLIDQTSLNGGPAYTETELIQLIINNINNSGSDSEGKIWDCRSTLACALPVPNCWTTSGLTNPDTLESIITALMNEFCDFSEEQALLAKSIQKANVDVAAVKAMPKGDINPTLKSVYVDKENSTKQPIAVLLNKLEVAYGHTADNLGNNSKVLTAITTTPNNILPLNQPVSQQSSFVPPLIQNPTSIAEALTTTIRLVNDLRLAVKELQINSSNTSTVTRMVDIHTFYASSATCLTAVQAIAHSNNCYDLWNKTGVQFDPLVRAYSNPSGHSIYELTHNRFYVLCAEEIVISQYLGGVGGTTTGPFWTTPVSNCA
jgi:hypothetical protein